MPESAFFHTTPIGHACKAGETTAFAFGDASDVLSNYAWCLSNSSWPGQDDSAHLVVQQFPNAFRLYDMHGNVRKWVGDGYGLYSAEAQVDPTGAAIHEIVCSCECLRGGA